MVKLRLSSLFRFTFDLLAINCEVQIDLIFVESSLTYVHSKMIKSYVKIFYGVSTEDFCTIFFFLGAIRSHSQFPQY